MRSKKKTASKAAPRIVPKFAVMPFKRSDFGEKISNMPKEVKMVGALLLMLLALYTFQVVSQPSFLKSQVSTITGLVVSDSEEQTEPAATTTTTAATAAAPKQQQQTTTTTATVTTPTATAPKIVEPAKGSTVSPGFTVKIELPTEALTCYYQTRDDGTVKWDRRMKPCRTEISVEKGYCSTVGKNTCYIVVEAYDGNGNGLGSDSAYYSIQ